MYSGFMTTCQEGDICLGSLVSIMRNRCCAFFVSWETTTQFARGAEFINSREKNAKRK